MKITLPKNAEAIALERLEACASNHNACQEILNLLETVPALADSPKGRRLLQRVVERPIRSYRMQAAKVLRTLGDPLATQHFVFNGVRRRPLLGEDHFGDSDWHDFTVRVLSDLTIEHVDLLIADALHDGLSHAMTLSRRSEPHIRSAMSAALDGPDHPARNAAYTLALMGDDSVLPFLTRWAHEDPYPRAAFVALSHLPNKAGAEALERFSDERHINNDQGVMRKWFVQEAFWRHAIVTGRSCADVLREYAMPEISSIRIPNRQARAANEITLHTPVRAFVRESVLAPYPPNLIWEFASQAERLELVATQRKAVGLILDQVGDIAVLHDCRLCPFVFPLHPTGRDVGQELFYKLDGFCVDYDAEDYLLAATDWIMRPEEYVLPVESVTLISETGSKLQRWRRHGR